MKTELTDKEIIESEAAVEFLKSNKKDLITKFVTEQGYRAETLPVSIFMAGSPGAGKTEFSKGLIRDFKDKPLRIDADEIRDFFPNYNKRNSYIFQAACGLGVDKLIDEAINKNISMLLDGTFCDRSIVLKNIKRSIDHGRKVEIYYLYQDPLIAWEFTQKREKVEGRNIPKEVFINTLFMAGDNVNEAKRIYKDQIKINLVIKDFKNDLKELYLNISSVDKYKIINYNAETLRKEMK